VSEVKPNFASGGWINVAGRKTAHLTSEAVAVKNFRTEPRRDAALELDSLVRRLFRQDVLSRFQIGNVIVSDDLPSGSQSPTLGAVVVAGSPKGRFKINGLCEAVANLPNVTPVHKVSE